MPKLWLQPNILLRKPHTSVSSLAKAIVEQLTYFDRILPSNVPTPSKDGVKMYAIELFTLSLLWHSFHDAIREGDGNHIIRYWRFLTVIFKSTNHQNYGKEAVSLQLLYRYFGKTESTTIVVPLLIVGDNQEKTFPVISAWNIYINTSR